VAGGGAKDQGTKEGCAARNYRIVSEREKRRKLWASGQIVKESPQREEGSRMRLEWGLASPSAGRKRKRDYVLQKEAGDEGGETGSV